MTKTSIAYGEVDIRSAHFLLSYSEECGGIDWEPIAVLSIEKEVEDMRLQLLVHNIRFRSAIDLMQKELHYYLFELNNPDNIGYLISHCYSLSNVYSRIHSTFIDRIDKENLFYYILTDAKLKGIFNTVAVTSLQQRLAEITVDFLFAEALDKELYDTDQYNKDLYYFFELLVKELPSFRGFHVADKPTLIEFSESIAKLPSMEFCNIIRYLKKAKLIKGGNIDRLLYFYCKNEKVHNFEK